jgi:hypothetical protein
MMACIKVRMMNEIKAQNTEMPDALLANWPDYVKRYPLATKTKWSGKWVESLKNNRWYKARQFPQPLCKLFFLGVPMSFVFCASPNPENLSGAVVLKNTPDREKKNISSS